MQNVLSMIIWQDNIQPDVERLNSNFIHKSIGLEVNGMIYFAVPVGSEKIEPNYGCLIWSAAVFAYALGDRRH